MLPRFGLPLLLVITASLFFSRLDCALLEPEETRYAEIPREMLVAGEWVIPQYHGQSYLDKPPLLYWLVMLSYSTFGIHDWAARIVPGCCGVVMVLAVYLWGMRTLGARPAFLGALVLALSCRFIYLGRLVATDAPLAACVVVALACYHIAIVGPRLRWGWWIGAGVACGLGLLAKGPVVFILVGVPIVIYLLVNKQAARPRALAWVAIIGTALLAASPWFIAAMVREPGFAEYFFWKHHVLRYVAPFDHAKPFWFYLPEFFAGTLPWSLLLVPLAVRLWKSRSTIRSREAPAVIFPLIAAIWCVAFFSASGSKRVGYVLPAFAPLALAIGEQIDYLLSRVESTSMATTQRWLRALPLTALLMGGACAAGLAAFHYWSMAVGIVVAGSFFAIALIVTVRRHSLAPRACLLFCAVVVFGECLIGIEWMLPQYADRFSLRREVLATRDAFPSGQVIACYPRGWDSINFYLQRTDARVFTEAERQKLIEYAEHNPDLVLFLRDGDARHKLLAELPARLQFSEMGRQGSVVVGRLHLCLARPGMIRCPSNTQSGVWQNFLAFFDPKGRF